MKLDKLQLDGGAIDVLAADQVNFSIPFLIFTFLFFQSTFLLSENRGCFLVSTSFARLWTAGQELTCKTGTKKITAKKEEDDNVETLAFAA